MPGGWSADKQRVFIARLAVHGSACKACEELGMDRTGVAKLYKAPMGGGFRAAWDKAVALAKRRRAEQAPAPDFVSPGIKPPTLDHRFKARAAVKDKGRGEGQVRNEYGEWEDEGSLRNRAEEARERILHRMMKMRQRHLEKIRDDPAKRQAFEILYGPEDWDNLGSWRDA